MINLSRFVSPTSYLFINFDVTLAVEHWDEVRPDPSEPEESYFEFEGIIHHAKAFLAYFGGYRY